MRREGRHKTPELFFFFSVGGLVDGFFFIFKEKINWLNADLPLHASQLLHINKHDDATSSARPITTFKDYL